jgi:hypothetical protein
MNQNIRFCRSADGVKLAYAISGEGPPPLRPLLPTTHRG